LLAKMKMKAGSYRHLWPVVADDDPSAIAVTASSSWSRGNPRQGWPPSPGERKRCSWGSWGGGGRSAYGGDVGKAGRRRRGRGSVAAGEEEEEDVRTETARCGAGVFLFFRRARGIWRTGSEDAVINLESLNRRSHMHELTWPHSIREQYYQQ
jgi:hypothetical protein